jgi:hypothetical protein
MPRRNAGVEREIELAQPATPAPIPQQRSDSYGDGGVGDAADVNGDSGARQLPGR